MYRIETNFGTYNLSLMPTTEDICKYYSAAHKAGVNIPAIKFQIVEIEPIQTASISTILSETVTDTRLGEYKQGFKPSARSVN